VLGDAFSVLNRGKYRVIRRFGDSVYFENPNLVEETVALGDNFLSLGYDGTTEFDVDASSNSLLLRWNGVGTEPSLGAARPGDVLRLGTDFAVANRGEFMVTRSGDKRQEVTQLTMPSGAQLAGGQSFHINTA